MVLGTSFNIHAYDEAVKTTLVEGAVKLNVAGKAYRFLPVLKLMSIREG